MFDISKCELGIHSGTKEQALDCITNANGRLIHVNVTLNNPLRLTDRNNWDALAIWQQLIRKRLVRDPERRILNEIGKGNPTYDNYAFIRQTIQDLGYDGVIYLNREEGLSDTDLEKYQEWIDENEPGGDLTDNEFVDLFPSAKDSYIAFMPSQIEIVSD